MAGWSEIASLVGPPGPKGATGQTGPVGPAGVNWRGTWSSSTTYALNDGVNQAGSSYVSLVASNTNNPPNTSPSDWAILAAAGQSLQPINWKGTWSAGTTYQVNDAVTVSGSSYVSLVANNTNNPPATSPSDWQLLAQAGAPGAAGGTGPAGPVGPPGMNWRGAWTSTANYAIDDGVSDKGSSYICVVANTNSEPPSVDWQLLAQAGQGGPPGQTGAPSYAKLLQQFTQGAQGAEQSCYVDNGGAFGVGLTIFVSPVGYQMVAGISGNTLTVYALMLTGDQAQGSIAPVGSPVSGAGPEGGPGPTGPTGPPGAAFTECNTFTVPAIGQNVDVTVIDSSWMTVGQVLWIAGAGPTGGAGSMKIVQINSKTDVTLQNIGTSAGVQGDMMKAVYDTANRGYVDRAVSADSMPLATVTATGAVNKLSGNTTDFLDGTNTFEDLATAVRPTIYSVRLRSFNAIGNPNCAIDQKQCGTSFALTSGVATGIDRWQVLKTGMATGTANGQQITGGVFVPGTNFYISNYCLRITLTAQQATLAAGDILWFNQNCEGPVLRELFGDVHSISLLVRSSVANLTFGLALRDSNVTHSLTKLCTLGAANTWTLITLPALPIWVSGGSWPNSPGALGYSFSITLACGSQYLSPANDTWQNGNFVGAAGQMNFAAQSVNSTFDIAFAQDEPGSVCTTLIDKPFNQNLTECQRYYQKAVGYATKPLQGAVIPVGTAMPSQASQRTNVRFAPTMAKTPTMSSTGTTTTLNQAYLDGTGNLAITPPYSATDSGWYGFTFSAAVGAGTVGLYLLADWTADTGW